MRRATPHKKSCNQRRHACATPHSPARRLTSWLHFLIHQIKDRSEKYTSLKKLLKFITSFYSNLK
jgi:hypothetical protein